MSEENPSETEVKLKQALNDIAVVTKPDTLPISILDSGRMVLYGMPKPIRRMDMYNHWRILGHVPDDISSHGSLPQAKIRCPIYWDNDKRRDIIFNNYLCTCGRLYVFKAKFQVVNGKDVVAPDYDIGICPCEVCRHFADGLGCRYEK